MLHIIKSIIIGAIAAGSLWCYFKNRSASWSIWPLVIGVVLLARELVLLFVGI